MKKDHLVRERGGGRKPNTSPIVPETQELSVDLSLTEKDLKNPGVARRILVDNENLKREIETFKESLKISQNSFEKLREKYHQADKDNAVLKQKVAVDTNFEIIKTLSSIGFGSAVTFGISGSYIVATILGVLSLIVYIAAVIRRDMKI